MQVAPAGVLGFLACWLSSWILSLEVVLTLELVLLLEPVLVVILVLVLVLEVVLGSGGGIRSLGLLHVRFRYSSLRLQSNCVPNYLSGQARRRSSNYGDEKL